MRVEGLGSRVECLLFRVKGSGIQVECVALTKTRFGTTMEREFFIKDLLLRIHFIIVMIRWTGLAPWEFEFPFPGSLTSTYQCMIVLAG